MKIGKKNKKNKNKKFRNWDGNSVLEFPMKKKLREGINENNIEKWIDNSMNECIITIIDANIFHVEPSIISIALRKLKFSFWFCLGRRLEERKIKKLRPRKFNQKPRRRSKIPSKIPVDWNNWGIARVARREISDEPNEERKNRKFERENSGAEGESEERGREGEWEWEE